jgi:hypothetical protein
MEIGSEEWLQLVKDNHNFPCAIAFILIKEEEGTTGLYSTAVDIGRKSINNVKYSDVVRGVNGKDSIVLSFKEIKNADEYLEEILRLKSIWGFAIIEKGVPK